MCYISTGKEPAAFAGFHLHRKGDDNRQMLPLIAAFFSAGALFQLVFADGALAWGLNHHVLDRGKFLPVVRKGWKGLVACVSEEGKLGWVQPVGEAPEAAGPDSTHEYAVGLFLLAGEEMIKLQSR